MKLMTQICADKKICEYPHHQCYQCAIYAFCLSLTFNSQPLPFPAFAFKSMIESRESRVENHLSKTAFLTDCFPSTSNLTK